MTCPGGEACEAVCHTTHSTTLVLRTSVVVLEVKLHRWTSSSIFHVVVAGVVVVVVVVVGVAVVSCSSILLTTGTTTTSMSL